ncbi:MAG: DUF3592 domain-containing protein [Brachybacterium sp.]|nr:DUF3592 domain-containing protein [Brachybacterium sp.]
MGTDIFQSTELMFVLIPGLFAVIALVFMATGVRDLIRGSRLASRGTPTRGVVRETFVRHYGARDSRPPHRIETIEFTTHTGQTIRDAPVVADIGMADRSEQAVDVYYERAQPHRFIAPKNGRSLSPVKPIVKIAICAAVLAFLSLFPVMAMGMPTFGG